MEHLGRNFAIEFPFERHQEFFKDCNRVKRDKVLKKRLMSLKWKFNGKIESLVIHSSDIFFFLSRKKSSSNCTFSYSNNCKCNRTLTQICRRFQLYHNVFVNRQANVPISQSILLYSVAETSCKFQKTRRGISKITNELISNQQQSLN